MFLLILSIISSALLKVLLNSTISPAPSKANWVATALAAPPPPTSTIFSPLNSTPSSSKDFTKPLPSVLYPINFPFSFLTVLLSQLS